MANIPLISIHSALEDTMPEYFRFIRITFDPSKYDAMMAHADSQVERIKGVPGAVSYTHLTLPTSDLV